LATPQTLETLCAAVAKHYEIDPVQSERDVTAFVSEMKSVGLVEVPALSAMAGD
jgi:hypothetical protein